MISLPADRLDAALGCRFILRHGIGPILRRFLASLDTHAAHIRRRRLQQCRTDLADPAWLRQPVQVIGARWGFTSPSSFSRAFRQTFGTSSSTYRRSLRTPSGPSPSP
ncbi:helix-turn-helix domain-containing protein [Nonomuraea sp. NPDC055795]